MRHREYHRRTKKQGPVPKDGFLSNGKGGLHRVDTANQFLEENQEHKSDVVQKRQEFQAPDME